MPNDEVFISYTICYEFIMRKICLYALFVCHFFSTFLAASVSMS